ncbi:hypothetical protein F0Z19_4741 [Vibrio cyclitrophicus]|nr:hypothetical protein F0Z19_4741 [Vibrio cyclitrophicus]
MLIEKEPKYLGVSIAITLKVVTHSPLHLIIFNTLSANITNLSKV